MSVPELERTWVWGVPFSRVDFQQAIDAIEALIIAGSPRFVITANLHYAMLSGGDARLRANNDRAAMVLADGMPIVWASRWRDRPLPARVTGADLVPALCERAAAKAYGVFLLGAAPGVADEAAIILQQQFPGLRIVGVRSPPFRALTLLEHKRLIEEIRSARPDLLFVAFGQPKGEVWVADNCTQLGVPVCMQIGATLDFISGRVLRAPRWMQRVGLEWLFRFLTEPWRLGQRYAANALFAGRMMLHDLVTRKDRRA